MNMLPEVFVIRRQETKGHDFIQESSQLPEYTVAFCTLKCSMHSYETRLLENKQASKRVNMLVNMCVNDTKGTWSLCSIYMNILR